MKKEGQLMEKEKKTFVDWIKEHKKELIIAGVSIATIIAVIVGIKNHKALEEAWASLRKLVEKTPEMIPVAKLMSVTEVTPVKDIVEINIVTADRKGTRKHGSFKRYCYSNLCIVLYCIDCGCTDAGGQIRRAFRSDQRCGRYVLGQE